MKNWEKDSTKIFKGKTIKRIKYMTKEDAKKWDWKQAPIIEFTDGHEIMASADDEGNGCGAFFTTHRDMSIIPQGEWT